MAPPKWDDEEDDSTPPSSPPPKGRRGKFVEEEEEDSDVLESWDAADDSEVEREKAKKAEEAKAKAEAEAKANHKTKTQRIEEYKAEKLRRKLEDDDDDESSDEEDEAIKRARLRQTEKDSDLHHAEDLFGNLGVSNNRSAAAARPVTLQDPENPSNSIDLSALPIFNPQTKDAFQKMRETLVPLISANSKKAHYVLFMQEFTKQVCKDLPSDQIKKIVSGLTTLSNEKMKEEKAEKGGKKSKAQKTKSSLVASRDTVSKADTTAYDELNEEDFM